MAFGIPFDQLYAQISHYFLIVVRIGALLHVAPVFSERSVNKRHRMGLAVLTALLIGSTIPDAQIGIYSWTGAWTLAKQVVIGAALGLMLQLMFAAVRLAGEVIGMQMGLSFASFFDPGSGNSPVISRFLNLLVTLLFLTFNGHLWLLALISETFYALPVNPDPLHAGGFLYLVTHAGLIFSQGLMLGLPIISLLLCINLTLGLLNRLTPQLSIFVVGFPLTLSVGMVALFLLAETLPPFFENLMLRSFEHFAELVLSLA